MRLDRWLEKDLTIRVLSVVLAFAMWFQVMGEQNPLVTRTFKSVAVVAENLDSESVLMELVPDTISLTLQGQRKTVGAIKDEDVVAYVDLKDFDVGKGVLPVSVVCPKSVEITQTLPQEVAVLTDYSSQKRVKVDVRALGVPAEDYIVLGGHTEFVDAQVSGAQSIVSLVTRVVADVDVTGATDDISKHVGFRALDVAGKEVAGIAIEPKSAMVTVSMHRLPPGKTVRVETDVAGVPRPGYMLKSVSAEPETVLVRGPAEVIENVESVLTLRLDVQDVASSFERRLDLVLPPGTSLVDPATVLAKVVIVEDLIEREFTKTISVTGLDPSLRATLSETETLVSLIGQRPLVQALTTKDITVAVDVSLLGEGEHEVSVVIEAPEGVVLLKNEPETIVVTIKTR